MDFQGPKLGPGVLDPIDQAKPILGFQGMAFYPLGVSRWFPCDMLVVRDGAPTCRKKQRPATTTSGVRFCVGWA